MRSRRTRIVATVGPASSRPETLVALADAGVDVFRMNFSHGTAAEHVATARRIREITERQRRNLALLQDLPGPKIRVGRFQDGGADLVAGRPFRLWLRDDATRSGTSEGVTLSYPGIARDIDIGQKLLLDDGHLRLRVTAVATEELETEVEVGGHLTDHKGVSAPGAEFSVDPLTQADLAAMEIGAEIGVDWVAQSFVRCGDDVQRARAHLETLGSRARLIAKIETPAAVERFPEILEAADGIMVARGDLGVEMPPEEVPVVQKRLIASAHAAGKPVITATQMLESMIENARPTRAETSDVANAIFDGTDAVMLSAETAAGRYPVESVQMMRRVADVVEASSAFEERRRLLRPAATETTPDAIAKAACEIAETLDARAILVFTNSGSSAWRIARNRPRIPVLALTPQPTVRGELALAFGVRCELAPIAEDTDQMVGLAIDQARSHGMAEPGERIVITAGVPFGVEGTTNLVWVERVR